MKSMTPLLISKLTIQTKSCLMKSMHLLIKNKTPVFQKISSFQYELKNRTLLSYKTPAYQCQEAGTVELKIGVNENGQVILVNINKANSSNNKCLIDASISYGKQMQFSKSKEAIQYGTISFFTVNAKELF